MQVQADTIDGMVALRVVEHDLSAVVLPELGAKVSSLRWQGHELLAQNPRKALRLARYAAPYAEFDASGFDECFPSIGPCRYAERSGPAIEIPDHGEVWSIPWAWEVGAGGLHLNCRGIRMTYEFHKTLAMPSPGCLRLSYALVNHGDSRLKFNWSAHPLLGLRPGMRIYLPPGARVRIDWSKDERLGELWDEHPWPYTTDRAGRAVDLSLILPADASLVDKLYTTYLREGWCALHDPETERYAAFLFSPESIPYVGLSINLGGWPVDGPGYYNLGLEPCSGYPDRLDLAIERGVCVTAEPGQRLNWTMDLCVGQAADMLAEIARLRGLYAANTELASEAAA